MACISLGNLNKKGALIAITIILYTINSFQYELFGTKSINKEDIKISFDLFMTYLGDLLVGLIQVYLNHRSKRSDTMHKKSTDKIEIMTVQTSHRNTVIRGVSDNFFSKFRKNVGWDKVKFFLTLFVFFTFDFFSNFVSWAMIHKYKDSYKKYEPVIWVMQFIYACLLCAYFLRMQLFKHHYVSFVLIFIGCVLVFIRYLNLFEPYLITFFLIANLFFAVFYTYCKWLMDTKFISHLFIIHCIGIYGLIVMLILTGILQNFSCTKNLKGAICTDGYPILSFKDYKILFRSAKHFFQILFILIIEVLTFIYTLVIIKIFSPTHKIILDITSAFIHNIIDICIHPKTGKGATLSHIAFCLILIGCVIFNEFIILHFWGLNENTKEQISMRQDRESEVIESEIQQELAYNENLNEHGESGGDEIDNQTHKSINECESEGNLATAHEI